MSKLDKILTQAFTDGASDTMWQNDRHVEIFAAAKFEIYSWFREEAKKLVGEDDPTTFTLPATSDYPGSAPAAIAAVNKSRNELRAELRTAIDNYKEEL